MLALLRTRFGFGGSDERAALSNAFELGADGEVPTEFRIFRAGVNKSDKGNFLFDEEAARLVMASFAKKGKALTIDYEHMAAADPPVIAPAAASSWTPEVRNGELWATNVNWTPKARDYIKNREYTRASPLFQHEKKTLRIVRVLNCALTNVEALDNFEPLVAASTSTDTGDRSMKKLSCKACNVSLKAPTDTEDGDEVMCTACGGFKKALSAVGLRVDMAEGEAIAELSGLSSFKATVFGLTGKNTIAEALGVVSGWKSNDQEIARLRAEVDKVQTAGLTAEMNKILDQAGTDGKLAPAERESLVALATARDGGKVTAQAIELVKANIATRTKGVNTKETPSKETTGGLLSADDIVMARAMGHSEADVSKWKKEQLTSSR